MKVIVIFLVTLFLLASSSPLTDNDQKNGSSDIGNSTIASPQHLGFCWNKICSENQYCNEAFSCQCNPGFKNYDGICIPCAEENEECSKTSDCCGLLLCIGGICRKAMPDINLKLFSKICLSMTAISILIVVLSFFFKLIIRSRYGGREEDRISINSTPTWRRQFANPKPSTFEAMQEKPPSYEECIRSSPRSLLSEPPPPYTISTNNPPSDARNDNHLSSLTSSLDKQSSSIMTPLNIQSLERAMNSRT